MKTKIYAAVASAAALAVFAAACSSNSGESENRVPAATATETSAPEAAAPASETTATADTAPAAVEEASVVVPFTAANGSGTVAVSGDGSPVAAWLGGLPGEVSLDLLDADVNDAASVVEELVSFWFFHDDDSGDVPPSIYVSAGGVISDSGGTSYVVEAQPLPPAPGTGTTTTSPTVPPSAGSVPEELATSGSVSPETSEPPSSTTTTTTTAAATAAASTTTTSTTATTTSTTTTTTIPSADDLRVQVLNGSGISGAAGRLSERLEDAGWDMLPAVNAPRRYAVSAVYYSHDVLKDQAAEIAVDTGVSGVVSLAMPSPAPFLVEGAGVYVVVLIGADDLGASLRPPARASSLRPRPRSDVALPLPDDVPRDRFVPGLADIQIFSAVNDNSPIDEVRGNLDAISSTLNVIGRYSAPGARLLAFDRNTEEYCEQQRAINPQEICTVQDYEYLQFLYTNLERAFAYFGFTPQNVCGAPAGYSFTDLLEPTREWNEEINTWSGDAIFTTDRLIELHGGPRINPEENLNFYIQQAAQTAHDMLRLPELLDETEAPQLVLCAAWLAPSGELPEFANAAWYTLLTPGTRPQENLLSQGTYHVKEISRNGNMAYLYICHPTLGVKPVYMWWRAGGYRAELTTGPLLESRNWGCQEFFEADTYFYEDTNGAEATFRFSFGEQVFSASDLSGFPRN